MTVSIPLTLRFGVFAIAALLALALLLGLQKPAEAAESEFSQAEGVIETLDVAVSGQFTTLVQSPQARGWRPAWSWLEQPLQLHLNVETGAGSGLELSGLPLPRITHTCGLDAIVGFLRSKGYWKSYDGCASAFG